MNPDEAEFLGEKQFISIIPTFNSGVVHLISGDVGPFRASLPTRVPLWMAINLKQQQKCKIQHPEWMNVDQLERIKEDEKKDKFFTKMPSEQYMIEAKLLLGCASDDVPKADDIRTIIKDIWDIRMAKLRSSVNNVLKSADSYAEFKNLTVMEINSIRPILPHALDQIYRMKINKHQGAQSTTLSTPFRTSTSFSNLS
ncbi:unnamed protein product [Phaedon cochleariae]|uniref:DNA replication complex GINS protein PSF2 n=1 Tax=Phaedon cochleariae TaxID=80249 RepID=A0A9N9SCX2_PHACE|nr:unnamed protein product [Phaedon cochleariae]